jgi:hypothetical protein
MDVRHAPPLVYVHASATYGKYGDSLPRVFLADPWSLSFESIFGYPEGLRATGPPKKLETPFGQGLAYSLETESERRFALRLVL